MKELKSCPFCGNIPTVNKEINEWDIGCCTKQGQCFIPINDFPFKTEAEAITAWNTRKYSSMEYLTKLFSNSKTNKSGCIEWQRRCSNRGYGEISYLGNKSLTHRVMYELIYGPIPEGKCVCHHCDNPPCINPTHLFLGTQFDNMQDCIKKKRKNMPVGENHPAAKLTEKQAWTIKNSPLLTDILAKDFGVSKSTIKDIRRGTTWKHLN